MNKIRYRFQTLRTYRLQLLTKRKTYNIAVWKGGIIINHSQESRR